MANRLTPINFDGSPDIRVVNDNFQETEQMIDDVQSIIDSADTKADDEATRATDVEDDFKARLATAETNIEANTTALAGKQDKLIAGANIEITEDDEINVIDDEAEWGNVTGTLSNQVDLTNELGSYLDGLGIDNIVAANELPENTNPTTLYVITEAPTPTWEGLKFTATQDNSSVGYAITGSLPDIDIQYSTDEGSTWQTWDGTAIPLNNGESICVKNNANTLSRGTTNYFKFVMSGQIAASGNVMSMINYASITYFCFYVMFRGCHSLTTAPELPATTLNGYCYCNMFYGCTNLTTAPSLPATTLANNCYEEMFGGCSNLATAPELPALTLAESCYKSMFSNCTNLVYAPDLLATTLQNNCYDSMFRDCSGLRRLPDLPATTLADFCYYRMFSGCSASSVFIINTSLPATTLASNCYQQMFYNCSLITSVYLPATTLTSDCYSQMFGNAINLRSITIEYTGAFNSSYCYNWVNGVSSSGTFYYNGSDTARGTSAIPMGWAIQTF